MRLFIYYTKSFKSLKIFTNKVLTVKEAKKMAEEYFMVDTSINSIGFGLKGFIYN
jgi:hypothetical protein